MRVQYQMSEDDFVAAASLGRRRLLRTLIGVQILGGLMIAFTVVSKLIGRTPQASVPEWIVPLLMIIFPLLIRRQFRQVFRKSPVIGEPRSLTVDESGIEFDSASARGHVTWSAYVSFVEDARSFALFQQGKQIFIPIPKREMSPIQITELSSLFETHIGRK